MALEYKKRLPWHYFVLYIQSNKTENWDMQSNKPFVFKPEKKVEKYIVHPKNKVMSICWLLHKRKRASGKPFSSSFSPPTISRDENDERRRKRMRESFSRSLAAAASRNISLTVVVSSSPSWFVLVFEKRNKSRSATTFTTKIKKKWRTLLSVCFQSVEHSNTRFSFGYTYPWSALPLSSL